MNVKSLLFGLLAIGVLLTSGCAGLSVSEPKPIPYTALVVVRVKNGGGINGESINQTLTINTNTGEIPKSETAIGSGPAAAWVGAAGNVAGATLWGHSLEPSDYNVKQIGGGATQSQEQKSKSATKVDVDVNPPGGGGKPRERPPSNRPPFRSPKDRDR